MLSSVHFKSASMFIVFPGTDDDHMVLALHKVFILVFLP